MSRQPVFLVSLSLMFCTSFILTPTSGQDGARLPDLGVEMTFKEGSMPVTPATIERGNVFESDGVELQLLLPLSWELEKHRIYQELMQKEFLKLEDERGKAIAEREIIFSELAGIGTTSLEQLDQRHLSLQEAKLQLAVLDAEAVALRDAVDQRKASIAKQSSGKAEEAISLQRKLVEFAERKKQRAKQLFEANSAPAGQVLEADEEVTRAHRELALMEAEANQPPDSIVDAMLSRLAEIEPQKKAVVAKAEGLAELTKQSAHIRQLVHESQQTERNLDLLEERRNQLTTRLREQKLRTEYLELILNRYKEALKSARSRNAASADE